MSGGDRFSHSSAPVRRIKAMQFGILDPDFIVSDGHPFPIFSRTASIFMMTRNAPEILFRMFDCLLPPLSPSDKKH